MDVISLHSSQRHSGHSSDQLHVGEIKNTNIMKMYRNSSTI